MCFLSQLGSKREQSIDTPCNWGGGRGGVGKTGVASRQCSPVLGQHPAAARGAPSKPAGPPDCLATVHTSGGLSPCGTQVEYEDRAKRGQ